MMSVFEVMSGWVNAGIAGADEDAVGFGDYEVDMGGSEHSVEVVVADWPVFDGGVHGTFGADDTLFEAQKGGEIGCGGGADSNWHIVKVRLVFKEIFHFRDKDFLLPRSYEEMTARLGITP
jgi:hypothetical protein